MSRQAKKTPRQIKAKKKPSNNHLGFELKEIEPKGEAQRQTFETFLDNHLLLHGYAGTGKTFLSLYLALREVLEYPIYHKIIIVRSAVQTRDLGFMPGSLDEKIGYYERPYADVVNDLCCRGDAYDIMKGKHIIEFMCTSFIRGLTLDNAIVIVDEVQNMTFEELDSVITRCGNHTKIVFAGDFRQSDLKHRGDRDGLIKFMGILDKLKGFEHIEFRQDDIVRSGLVKQYIIEKTELNL
jgi:phosphate starvation-inducible protein PhoH